MAKFDVVDMSGKKVSTVELSDAVFGITPNEKAVHEAVVNFLANQRQGMHAGYTATSKKAIVTLKPDSKEIEFFNSMV